MKKLNALKLSLLTASVAGLGVGCASSGYARYDGNADTNPSDQLMSTPGNVSVAGQRGSTMGDPGMDNREPLFNDSNAAGSNANVTASGGAGQSQTGTVSGRANVNGNGMDVNAGANVATDRDLNSTRSSDWNQQGYASPGEGAAHTYGTSHKRFWNSHQSEDPDDGAARVTVTALSFTPPTQATLVNKFPFWMPGWQLRTINLYTFAVPDPTVSVNNNLPQFSENLPPGSVFVESAGGAGEVNAGRIIQHSPLPIH